MVAIRWVIQRLAHPISAMLVGTSLISASAALAQDADETKFPGPSHYLRGAYQFGKVLQTNGFLKGDNQSGEPIDSFQSVRLEFGWQTDGSKDWHHVYNFPTFGIGLYGADFNNDEELGTPTSLYGFFGWPMARSGRWRFDFELAFGFTNDWKPYDPVTNPNREDDCLGVSVGDAPPACQIRNSAGRMSFRAEGEGARRNSHGARTNANTNAFSRERTSAPIDNPRPAHRLARG